MRGFLFLYGDDERLNADVRRAAAASWGNIQESHARSLHVFAAETFEGIVRDSARTMGALVGYVFRENAKDAGSRGAALCDAGSSLFDTILDDSGWPLADEWTGSFSAVSSSKREDCLVLCNDVIGYLPLYYAHQLDCIVGGTSLIALSRCLPCRADPVGVVQAITPPYCLYGRRTILEGVVRLMPGEWMRYDPLRDVWRHVYDNTLYGATIEEALPVLAPRVWDLLTREIRIAVNDSRRVAVGLSGGWDSRLKLAGLHSLGLQADCLTYGAEALYESSLARRCARAAGATHRCFPIEGKYFPNRKDLETLVRDTESANHLQWNAVLDPSGDESPAGLPILVGDMSDCLDGRNMLELSSRSARRRSYLQGLIGRATRLSPASPPEYERWRGAKSQQIVRATAGRWDNLAGPLASRLPREQLIEQVQCDLEESFERIVAHRVEFAAQYDELFQWFHRVRYSMAGQLLILSSRFHPLCPTLSLRMLRLTSRIHPGLKTRRRLLNAIAKLSDLAPFAAVPSAQVPWLGMRSPATLRELLWGARSAADRMFIRRMLAKRNPNCRQRVLRSLDLVREYRRPDALGTIAEWFSGRWVDPAAYVSAAQKRANLEAWPLIALDISAPANISLILDQCCLRD